MATSAQPVVGSTSAAPGGTEQTIPYARFKEVNDELKAFKELGFTRDEIQEALVALAAFVEREQAGSQAEPANSGNGGQQPNQTAPQNGQWTQQQWEQWALATFPWMREMRDAHEAQKRSTEGQQGYRVNQGREKLKALAIKAGYKEEQLKQLEDIVAAVIRGDEAMMAAWTNGDLSVVEQAFKAHQTGFVEPVARTYATSVSGRKAANRQELAPKVSGGAAPPPQQPAKPKTIEEAHGAAMDKLAESGSDLPEGEDEIVQE